MVNKALWIDNGSGPTQNPNIPQAEWDAMFQQFTLNQLTGAVQIHLDSVARQRNYDGILSACTYATSTNPTFAAEGQACVNWRDACWTKCYEVMAEVQAGNRGIPTTEELLSELPTSPW